MFLKILLRKLNLFCFSLFLKNSHNLNQKQNHKFIKKNFIVFYFIFYQISKKYGWKYIAFNGVWNNLFSLLQLLYTLCKGIFLEL